jgi:hypothetical protein
MIRRSIFSIAAVSAMMAVSAPPSSAQSAGAERCSAAGRVEVYTCTKDGATQRCAWAAQPERRCPLPATTKSTAVTLPAAAAPNISPTASAVRDARAANPEQPPAGGPAPSVKSNDTRTSEADRAAAIRAGAPTTDSNKATIDSAAGRLTGAAGSTSSVSSQLSDSAKKTDRPGAINATTKPQVDPGAVNRIGGNPMGVVGGSTISGPLADAAQRSSGVKSAADLGKSLMMRPVGTPLRSIDATKTGVPPLKSNETGDRHIYPDGSVEVCFGKCDAQDVVAVFALIKGDLGNEHYMAVYKDGQMKWEVLRGDLSDGTTITIDRSYDEKTKKWVDKTTFEPTKEKIPDPGTADPGTPTAAGYEADLPADNCDLKGACGEFNSAVLKAHREAMRRGAAGSTVNPDRNGDGFVSPCAGQSPGSVSGTGGGGGGGDSFGSAGQSTAKCGQELATSAATSGLVTNPGVAGGLGASGGPAMQDRTFTTTTGAGVITPTNDQNISGQGRQDDPGDFFGKKPTASLTPPAGTTGDDKDKDKDKDDKDKDNQSGSSQPPPK